MCRYYAAWDGTYVRFVPEGTKSNAGQLALKNVHVVLPHPSESKLGALCTMALPNSTFMRARHDALARNTGTVFAQFAGDYVEDSARSAPPRRTTYLD